MKQPDEIQVVEAFVAAINRHDPAALSSMMTQDHTFIDPSGRTHSGRETMVAGWQGYFQMLPDYQINTEKVLADKNLVAVFGSAAGTYNGKRGLIAVNKIAVPAAWKAVVESGKIKSWQVYADWTEGCKIMEEDQQTS